MHSAACLTTSKSADALVALTQRAAESRQRWSPSPMVLRTRQGGGLALRHLRRALSDSCFTEFVEEHVSTRAGAAQGL